MRRKEAKEQAQKVDQALEDVKRLGELAIKGETLGLAVLELCRDSRISLTLDLRYRIEILEPLALRIVPESIRRKHGLEG